MNAKVSQPFNRWPGCNQLSFGRRALRAIWGFSSFAAKTRACKRNHARKAIADRLYNYRLFVAGVYPDCVLRFVATLKDCEPEMFEKLKPSIEVWAERIRHFKVSAELFDKERWFDTAERSARKISFDPIQ